MRIKVKLTNKTVKYVDGVALKIQAVAKALGISQKQILAISKEW